MNVRTVCLSILYEGDATGYEIRRLCVEGECSYFVEASFGSIYPALAKLEDDGLVKSHIEQQDGKPAKKVYSITEAGRASFTQALFEPLDEEVFRSPFLLFARFAHILPAELVEDTLERTIAADARCQEKAERRAEQRHDAAHRTMGRRLRIVDYGGCGTSSAHPYGRLDHISASRTG